MRNRVNFPTLLMTADFVEETDASFVATTLQQALKTIVVAKPVELVQEDDF
ncbi:hypothetical protein [Vibrio taketomensis]|uniref:hypothetical protein n=1 Tax=Vibrio taketomensis TaxID=2572923 RepID=UPI00138A66B2|nr:hypothetical protein [Vibrio taketomensis]